MSLEVSGQGLLVVSHGFIEAYRDSLVQPPLTPLTVKKPSTTKQKTVSIYQIGISHLTSHVCCLSSSHNASLRGVCLHPLYPVLLGSCRQRYDLP